MSAKTILFILGALFVVEFIAGAKAAAASPGDPLFVGPVNPYPGDWQGPIQIP